MIFAHVGAAFHGPSAPARSSRHEARRGRSYEGHDKHRKKEDTRSHAPNSNSEAWRHDDADAPVVPPDGEDVSDRVWNRGEKPHVLDGEW